MAILSDCGNAFSGYRQALNHGVKKRLILYRYHFSDTLSTSFAATGYHKFDLMLRIYRYLIGNTD
jgi:hypothetical protein